MLDVGALALSALAGGSIWLSVGPLSVAEDGLTRTGALPPLWVLAALTIGAAACAWAVRLRLHESWPLTLALALWLPWLPLPGAAALAVWEGPLEIALWLTIAAGVVHARLHPNARIPEAWTDPARAPRWAAAGFLCCSLAAGAALQDRIPSGDEPHYLVITQSLLYDGDLKIENNHRRGDYFEYIGQEILPRYLRRGLDGEIYSIHAPGVSALVLPAFAIAGYPGALLLLSLLSAWAIGVAWRAAYALTGSAGGAWAATAALGTSASYLLHSFTIFPDPVGAVVVAAALYLLVKIDVAPETVRIRHWALAGAGLASLPWLHTRFALLAAAFGLVFVLRLAQAPSRWRALAAFAAVPLIAAAAWFTSFYLIYGTVNPAAPYGASRQNALEWMPAGAIGLLVDQQFGLGANAPVFALAGVGLIALWRSHRRLALEMTAIALPYTFVVTSFAMWWGGWSAPARFLVALLPLGVPLFAAAWQQGSVALRSVFAALVVVGTLNTAARAFAEGGALLYNLRDGYDLLLDWLSRTVNVPLALPSVHRLGVEPSALLGAIWLLAGVVMWLVLQFALRGRANAPGARWALTSWAVVAAITVALGVSWRTARTSPITSGSSKIAFVQRWQPETRPLLVRLPPVRRMTAEGALRELRLRSSSRARELPAERPLLAVGRLPAGDYRLVIDAGGPPAAGVVTASIGATSQTVEEWPLDGLGPGMTPFVLRLPALVHSLVLRGDDAARATVRGLSLQPERVGANRPDPAYARRASRYGRVQAFFLDDALYMEPAGIWTRGDASGEMVLQTAGELIELDVTAGAVAVGVTLSGETATEALELEPGERRRVRLAPGRWRVDTAGRFSPRDFDPASRDARPLGARLEFAQ